MGDNLPDLDDLDPESEDYIPSLDNILEKLRERYSEVVPNAMELAHHALTGNVSPEEIKSAMAAQMEVRSLYMKIRTYGSAMMEYIHSNLQTVWDPDPKKPSDNAVLFLEGKDCFYKIDINFADGEITHMEECMGWSVHEMESPEGARRAMHEFEDRRVYSAENPSREVSDIPVIKSLAEKLLGDYDSARPEKAEERNRKAAEKMAHTAAQHAEYIKKMLSAQFGIPEEAIHLGFGDSAGEAFGNFMEDGGSSQAGKDDGFSGGYMMPGSSSLN